MKRITTRNYQIMKDQDLVWNFMIDIYDKNWANGAAAPFWEYAISSSWMDTTYLYLDRMWFDGDTMVAFVYNESPYTDTFFSLRPGYEELADEMIEYAEQNMPRGEAKRQLVLFGAQKALMETATKHGYKMVFDHDDLLLDFKNELNHSLPEGYHFVKREDFDPLKLAICCWKGFNHEQDKGPFVNWDGPDPGTPWNPVKAMRGIMKSYLTPPPHSTQQYDVIIADETGEYVCYSGMWWLPTNLLAYMEPLCTVPNHRHKGLAAAALTAHYQRFKPLGATHMTGGGDDFYKAIGYEKGIRWTFWQKDEKE